MGKGKKDREERSDKELAAGRAIGEDGVQHTAGMFIDKPDVCKGL